MKTSVIVIGGGIAGVSIALYLRRAGLDVALIDPLPSPGGASFGNAGIISADTAVPIALPGMVRKIPGWLTDPLGPLTIRKRYLLHATPWLLRWLRAGRMSEVLRISDALRALHRDAWDVYRDLLGPVAFEQLMRPFGHIQIWDGEAESRTAIAERMVRARHGIEAQYLDGAALRKLLPGLSDRTMRGVLIPGNGHTVSPRRLTAHLAVVAASEGVRFVPERTLKLIPGEGGDWFVMTNAANHRVAKVVVAAGAWSGSLLEPLGVRVPLDTERGYHAMIPNPSLKLSHTVLHKDWGVSLSPNDDELCVSGTVEIAGLHAPPDERRAHILANKAKQLFPGLTGGEPTVWMGCRPSIPDSLPLIGPVARLPGLFLLFGHGHNGMTGGPTGARLLSQIIQGQPPGIDPAPYAVARFVR
jgi:glycine/D-amino acid oxidase-like deaminating enzyme